MLSKYALTNIMDASPEVFKEMRLSDLKEVCREFKIPLSGKKCEILNRILIKQIQIKNKKEQYKKRIEFGNKKMLLSDGSEDKEFENIMTKFAEWVFKTNWNVYQMSESGASFEIVPLAEIRASFKEYNPENSILRQDKYVPVPKNKKEIFLEMFFEKLGGGWEVFWESRANEDSHEKEFDEAEEINFSDYIKES